jgi:hypothetical protein
VKKLLTFMIVLAMAFVLSGPASALVLVTEISDIYAAGGLDVAIPGDPDFTTYTALANPFGGTITFDNPVEKRTVPDSWATWSHGYSGPVLFSRGLSSIRMDFGRSIYSFGFYAEPNIWEEYQITMGLSDGATQTKTVHGRGGAKFFGFMEGAVNWVEISTDEAAGGFAFGEMVTAIPEPTTILLFGLGTLGLGIIRKVRK